MVFPIQITSFVFHSIYNLFFGTKKEVKEIKDINIYAIIKKHCFVFKIINEIISYFLFFLPIIISLFTILTRLDNINKNGFSDVDKAFNSTGLLGKDNNFNNIKIDDNYLKSAMCQTKFYGLNLIQFASLAQVAYYEDIEKIKYYLNKSVFKDFKKYILSVINTINKKNAMLMMIDINVKNPKGIRVFSIRGTSSKKDIILDIELFVSSSMLSIIRLLPLIGNTESFLSKKVSELLTIPLRFFKEYTLANQYVEELSKKYEENQNTDRTIIFTGHSLGEGLAKLLGIKYNKQSISFSGPGVTPLEIEYSKNNNNYIKTNFVDIIPDKDIVPRVEVTSGTVYRVICDLPFLQALYKCHSIKRTVCIMGIMCDGEENYTGNICAGIYDSIELKKMWKTIRGDDLL